MKLKPAGQLLAIWHYAVQNGATVVLMRHAPKAGSDQSGLSPAGRRLAKTYGLILKKLKLSGVVLVGTDRSRTVDTLRLLFPDIAPDAYISLPQLRAPGVDNQLQKTVNYYHRRIGYPRGYTVSQTYYFLEQLGGSYGELDNQLHTAITERVMLGIKNLFTHQRLVIHCGHSPPLEAACCRLLGMTLPELGGFFNPLDSLHLRMSGGKIQLVARLNPIVGYVDLESETYYQG